MLTYSKLESYWSMCIVFCLVSLIMFMPDMVVAASTNDGISSVLCTIANQLTGPIGKGIGTIAVVALGIGLFLGKLSWGLAVATGIGIGMIFSASKVVNWLAGTASGTTSCATS